MRNCYKITNEKLDVETNFKQTYDDGSKFSVSRGVTLIFLNRRYKKSM